jgi:glucose/mannose-6-phosphate isomerase
MLDDVNVIKQHDPSGALSVAAMQYNQANFKADVQNKDHDGRQITNVVVAGMGGSALAALLVKSWLKTELNVPFEIIRSYHLPAYVGPNTLVIVSSYSGNTEEPLSCLEQAKSSKSQIAIIASDGQLTNQADANHYANVKLSTGLQPRMAVIYNLCALVSLLINFNVVPSSKLDEISNVSDWLKGEAAKWSGEITSDGNYAKQLALAAIGKTAIFYGGELTAPVAYKWKISWNENAKNVAFWNEIPEYNHNEFIGWTSHPVEKPFVVFDIISNFENQRILKRFEITDRLLSGLRPKSITVNLLGDTSIAQLLWGSILADFVSIYVAVLNGVNPTPVQLINKLKQELAQN